jgi:hypothetical protein
MGSFNNVSYEGLSVAECDTVALNNAGVLRSFGFSYNIPVTGDVNEEYSSVRINSQGMGNHGSLVLRGKTLRASLLLREGKIKLLTDSGVRRKTASISVSMHRGMEKDVAILADQLVELCQASKFNGHSRAHFQEWSGGVKTTLSMPRIFSAIAIAEKV